MICECYFWKYTGLDEQWDKDKETKMTQWLLSWVSKEKSDTTIENKKAEKYSSFREQIKVWC